MQGRSLEFQAEEKNMKNALLLAAAAALVGCAPAPGGYRSPLDGLREDSHARVCDYSESAKLQLAKNAPGRVLDAAMQSLADTLKNRSSAQFRNARCVAYLDGVVGCGEVNGKNSYWGYVGFKDFLASTRASYIPDTDTRYPRITGAANTGLDTACAGKPWAAPEYSS
jgi:hypothetical protein